ncbi:MAG: LptF/LptG family permease [Hyphomonadaceae bacterium]|nr:LptF/LptG family permease [Hyphomonadaceae bacterium]
MTRIQRYLFLAVLRTVVIIVGGLALLALLAQGLSQTDLIIENRQSAVTYFWIVMLGAPQIIALLTPLALFIAAVWSLNRIHRDSEIVVAQAAGMTRWQIASPIIRLAAVAAVAHLTINLWVQPAAQRTLRENVADIRRDLATALIQPGQFTQAEDKLTFYARESTGEDLRGILISDARDPARRVDYLAQEGTVIRVDGTPAIVMRKGQIHDLDENDSLSILDFEQYTFDLAPFMAEQGEVTLKSSDRYLHELFFVDRKNYLEVQNADNFLAEAHARLTTPLLNIAMAMIAIMAVVGGDFSRRGYSRRISFATAGALTLVIVQLSVQSAAQDDPAMNIVQWVVPLGVIGLVAWLSFAKGRGTKHVRQRRFLLRDRLDDDGAAPA